MQRMDGAGRRYGQEEIRRILSRAVEIQAREGEPGAGVPALSLEELQQIGTEVGIEPRHVAAAALETEGIRTATHASIWGPPARYETERVVAAAVSESDWPAMVAEIRRVFGHLGTTAVLGRSLEWQGEWGALVTLRPEGDEARLNVAFRGADLAIITHVIGLLPATLVGVGVAQAMDLSLLPGLVVVAGVITGSFALGRAFCLTWFRRKKHAADALANRLAELVGRGGTHRPEDASTAPHAGATG